MTHMGLPNGWGRPFAVTLFTVGWTVTSSAINSSRQDGRSTTTAARDAAVCNSEQCGEVEVFFFSIGSSWSRRRWLPCPKTHLWQCFREDPISSSTWSPQLLEIEATNGQTDRKAGKLVKPNFLCGHNELLRLTYYSKLYRIKRHRRRQTQNNQLLFTTVDDNKACKTN